MARSWHLSYQPSPAPRREHTAFLGALPLGVFVSADIEPSYQGQPGVCQGVTGLTVQAAGRPEPGSSVEHASRQPLVLNHHSQRPGSGTFCMTCQGCDHLSHQCAMAFVQQTTGLDGVSTRSSIWAHWSNPSIWWLQIRQKDRSAILVMKV